ncbi:MAG: biotin--[acetyl-CoA-carboxylase] ligase [Candidatus Methylomirabilia bacterium]
MAEASPDCLFCSRLAARLPRGLMGRAFYAFPVVISTQDELRRLGESGAPEGTVVVADHQTGGRGRQRRTWVDQPGSNLLFSLLLRPEMPAAQVPQLTLLAAVATREALIASTRLEIVIRWPNDLLVGRRKLAGILAEASALDDRVSQVILGIGINVNQTTFPELGAEATSLALELGHPLDREMLLEGLLAALDGWYTRCLREGFLGVREAWRQAAVSLGQPVATAGVAGVAEDLDVDGALLVRTGEGRVVRVVAGV